MMMMMRRRRRRRRTTTATTMIMAGDATIKCVGRKEFWFLSTYCVECMGNSDADIVF